MMRVRWGWAVWAAGALAQVACGGGGSAGTLEGEARLSVQAASPAAPIAGGGSGEMLVTLSNDGDVDARNVVLSTRLGTGLAAGPLTCTQATGAGACIATVGTGGSTRFDIGSVPAHSSFLFRLEIAAATASSGSIAATVAVASPDDASPDDNESTAAVVAYSADLALSASAPAETLSGGTARYSVTLSNAGPDAARDVVVAGLLDSGQAIGSIGCVASGGAMCPTGTTLPATVPSLPKNGTLTFTVPGTLGSVTNGSVQGSFSATAAGDPNAANNSVDASTAVTLPVSMTLQSDAGDYIGAGSTYAYSRTNAIFTVDATGGQFAVSVAGDENWSAVFQLPAGLTRFAAGRWAGLARYPFHDPAAGGLTLATDGRGCNTVDGSFAVTHVRYDGDTLAAIDLSFEQHCEGLAPALRGQIHWTAVDDTRPPGPVLPLPAGLWQPPAGSPPAASTYAALYSEPGDYIGAGVDRLFTSADSTFNVVATNGRLAVQIDAAGVLWFGDFQTMSGIDRLQPGYYGSLRRYPFHNPARGGLTWSGEFRGCNVLAGWFVVDDASYAGDTLQSIDLRFEQHCEGSAPALNGRIRWQRP